MKKKIVVKGPALSQTGYGEQTRFALRALKSREDLFDIYLINLEWGKSNHTVDDDEERAWIIRTIQKTGKYFQAGNPQFDLSLQVTIPNEFEKMAPINIGYTAGIETTKVSPVWLQKTHEFVDKLIVVSNHSKNIFESTVVQAQDQNGNKFPFKLTKPCHVINFPAREQNPSELKLDLKHDFNFLVVSQWGIRKNLENTVKWFVEENIDREVGLVLKTNWIKNCIIDRDHTERRLQSLLAPYKDRKCSVTLLHGYMTEQEMQGLYRHKKIKAFVSISHGEGFGLPLFDAAIAGLPIITLGWSGQCDFLYRPEKTKSSKKKLKSHFLKVDYDLLPVQKEAVWDGVIEKESQWAFAKEGSYKMALRKMKNEHPIYKGMAKKLSKWILENFTEESAYEEFVELVYGDRVVKIDFDAVPIKKLPKISFVTSIYNDEQFVEGFMKDITSQTIFEEKCELVLVNCNSQENEEKLIQPWLEKYPDNIKYIKLDEDPGIYDAWNLAIKESTGGFVSNANLDDRKSPEFAEKLAKFLYLHPDVDCVYTENLLTQKPHETFENNTANGQTYPAEDFSVEAMLRGNPPHCMPMWRREIHVKNGWFDQKYKSAGDWDFWLRCAFNDSTYKKYSEPLGLYYFNPKGMSTNPENNSWKREHEREIFQKFLTKFNTQPPA